MLYLGFKFRIDKIFDYFAQYLKDTYDCNTSSTNFINFDIESISLFAGSTFQSFAAFNAKSKSEVDATSSFSENRLLIEKR